MSLPRLLQGSLQDWLTPCYDAEGRCLPFWQESAAGAQAPEPQRPLIVIDVGHGNYRGPNGERVHDKGALATLNGKHYNEHSIALQVATRLKPLLEAEGFEVLLTQTGDGTPLANRFQARLDVGRNDPNKVMHMVLHANGSESAAVRGFAAMYHRDVPGGAQSQSARWAREMEREFPVLSRADGPTHNTSLIQPGTYTSPNNASWNITRGLGSLPAVLVEMGYMSNRNDLAELVSAEGQQRIAQRLVRATARHYDSMYQEGAVTLARRGAALRWADAEIRTLLLMDTQPLLDIDALSSLNPTPAQQRSRER